MDFNKHNEQVKTVWQAYRAGKPIRVPMILGLSSRFYMLDATLNKDCISYKRYFEDPQTMLDIQCRFQDFIRHNIIHDIEMGIPQDGWTVLIDFQNVFDAGWFGCKVVFPENQCPDTETLYTNEKKWQFLEVPPPSPFDGLMVRIKEFYEYFREQKDKFVYKGKPIKKIDCPAPIITDGPFTLGCQIRGAENFCMDMVIDTEYCHQLMDRITAALIKRIATWRKYFNLPIKENNTFMADDFIELISLQHYREFVLPYHKRIYEAFGTGPNRYIHLCGDATRHFPIIKSELKVNHFDTGFPVDFCKIREELGEDVEISGGPHVEILLNGSPDDVVRETTRILQTGIMKGGRFILREGNNLAPCTPLENIKKMYEICHKIGRY
jgi:uroporphyrinogen-III decarboxylase